MLVDRSATHCSELLVLYGLQNSNIFERCVSNAVHLHYSLFFFLYKKVLPKISRSNVIHVIEFHVFTTHGPDEGVVGGANAAVDAPGRADNSIIVVHHNMAGLGRLTAHVEYGLAFGKSRSRCRSPCGARGCGWAWCSSCCPAPERSCPWKAGRFSARWGG